MWVLIAGLTFGLLASALADTSEIKSRSCSHVGVFHVEGRDRYNLTFDDAKALCQQLRTVLASEEQIQSAYNDGLETCRYGWTANQSIAILRHTPHEKCFLNQTGINMRPANETEKSDAFCYDESVSAPQNCDNAINHYSTNAVTISFGSEVEPAVTQLPVTATAGPELEGDFMAISIEPTLNTMEETTQEHEHNETVIDNSSEMETEAPTQVTVSILDPTTEGVMSERGFNTSDGPAEEEQRSSPTEVTHLELPDDTTGSGIQPTMEESYPSSIPPVQEEVERETPQPEIEQQPPPSEDHPEPQPESVTESAVGRKANLDDNQEGKSGDDWLVIIGVVVAIAAIVLVCAAVATRKRWCGKHQMLNISKSGSSDGNGSASAAVAGSRAEEREQEMVTLTYKEKIQENGSAAEEFTAITVEGSSPSERA